ncbi:VOC family protein [Sporosarcina sp. E16_8]
MVDVRRKLFKQLSVDGQVLILLSPTPVSEKIGWVQDGYGVSWQLNLATN